MNDFDERFNGTNNADGSNDAYNAANENGAENVSPANDANTYYGADGGYGTETYGGGQYDSSSSDQYSGAYAQTENPQQQNTADFQSVKNDITQINPDGNRVNGDYVTVNHGGYTENIHYKKPHKKRNRFIAAMVSLTVLNLAIMGGTFFAGTRYGQQQKQVASKQELVNSLSGDSGDNTNGATQTANTAPEMATTEIAKKVGPAVVGIRSTMQQQAGFFGSAIAGAIGVVVILLMLHDTPESKGLPPVEALAHEKPAASADKSVKEIQKQVLRTPAVWILAAASAFMYISRYAINGWGVLFLQEAKGFSDVEAISVVSINALLGILGTVLSGWFSDKLFKGDRKVPALIFGVLNAAALALFFYGGNAMWVNVLSMVLFGIAIGVLICFLGGLMAVDIVPRKATGAALGVVGMTSYIAAGIQDVASGWLIDSNITVAADGVKHYDFGPVAIFWLAAAVISFLLPLLNRGKVKEF